VDAKSATVTQPNTLNGVSQQQLQQLYPGVMVGTGH